MANRINEIEYQPPKQILQQRCCYGSVLKSVQLVAFLVYRLFWHIVYIYANSREVVRSLKELQEKLGHQNFSGAVALLCEDSPSITFAQKHGITSDSLQGIAVAFMEATIMRMLEANTESTMVIIRDLLVHALSACTDDVKGTWLAKPLHADFKFLNAVVNLKTSDPMELKALLESFDEACKETLQLPRAS